MAQANFEDLRAQLLGLIEPMAAERGIDVVDVEVVGSQRQPTVRVRIDHMDEDADPITLDEVSAETGWISDALDEADPIEGSFTLEVSSPGLARPLRRAHDFERFAGERVSLTTTATEGRRRYTGILEGIDDDVVSVTCDEGSFSFPLVSIKSCNLKPDFDTSVLKPSGKR